MTVSADKSLARIAAMLSEMIVHCAVLVDLLSQKSSAAGKQCRTSQLDAAGKRSLLQVLISGGQHL
jgi:hypothetical protein